MNIGIVTTWFERGAAYVSKQFRDVLTQHHNVLIYARGGEGTGKGDPEWDFDYVTWGKDPDSFAPSDINLNDFKTWLESNNIDIVIFNEQKFWAPVLLCRELGVRNGAYIDYYTERSVQYFNLHDFVICNTKRHQSVFKDHSSCIFIPWGTDLSIYKCESTRPVDSNKITFFHSGGMSPYRKGTDLLIKAFEKHANSAHLIIHTQVKLGEIFPELNSLIDKLCNTGALTLIEKTVTAPGLFHTGDVYIYPSRLEGIGLSIMEAAACGLPVVVPDNGPMNEFIDDGHNGRLIEIEKVWSRWDGYYWPLCEAKVESLENILEDYIDQFTTISEHKEIAKNYAIKYFDWDKNSSGLASVLENIKRVEDITIVTSVNEAIKFDEKQLKLFKLSKKQKFTREIKKKYPLLYKVIKSFIGSIKKKN